MIDHEHFFGTFLKEKKNTLLIEAFHDISASVGIVLTDINTTWVLILTEGKLTSLECDATNNCDVYYQMETEVFQGIVERQFSPQHAFFVKKVDIKGDLFMGMKIAKLLDSFFEQYPYVIGGRG
ncbi:SCP2 sterol-binding domain-containing protein [Candidatus Omnitrophota bacterium]